MLSPFDQAGTAQDTARKAPEWLPEGLGGLSLQPCGCREGPPGSHEGATLGFQQDSGRSNVELEVQSLHRDGARVGSQAEVGPSGLKILQ